MLVVCTCSLSYPAWKEHDMLYTAIYALSGCTTFFLVT